MIEEHEGAYEMPDFRSIPTVVCLGACLTLSVCRSKPALEFGSGLDVPWVRTSPAVVRKMLEMAHVGKNDVVVDLGCGDGRIVIAAASQFGARGVGYDIDPARIAESRRNARIAGVEGRTRFVQQDLFEAPIGEASVVTLFLMPSVMRRIEPRLLSELGPGARIVSHSFTMADWPPEQTARVDEQTLYLWTVPERAPIRTR